MEGATRSAVVKAASLYHEQERDLRAALELKLLIGCML